MIKTYSVKDGENINPVVLNSMFSLRDRIFRERLGWDVQSFDNKEFDSFDDSFTSYVISTDQSERVNGCIRLRSTNNPYMLKNVFPELAQGEELPHDPHVWEASRFALSPEISVSDKQCSLCLISLQMLREAFVLAEKNGVRDIVTVASVAVERLYRNTGLDMQRFGNGKAQRVGGVLSVACHVWINDKTRQALDDQIHYYRQHQVAA